MATHNKSQEIRVTARNKRAQKMSTEPEDYRKCDQENLLTVKFNTTANYQSYNVSH